MTGFIIYLENPRFHHSTEWYFVRKKIAIIDKRSNKGGCELLWSCKFFAESQVAANEAVAKWPYQVLRKQLADNTRHVLYGRPCPLGFIFKDGRDDSQPEVSRYGARGTWHPAPPSAAATLRRALAHRSSSVQGPVKTFRFSYYLGRERQAVYRVMRMFSRQTHGSPTGGRLHTEERDPGWN